MMRRILGITSILSLLVFSCTKKDVAADGKSNSNTVVYNVNKATILELVNNVRKAGCNCNGTIMPPVAEVAWNDQLAKAAFDHSVDMKTNNYFSHTSLDGSTTGQRITAAGYNWSTYGENIANGYTTEQDVINGWLSSEGHCKNIMNADFKDMGVGRDGNYWTQAFGSK